MARRVLLPLAMSTLIDARLQSIPLERMSVADVLSCVEPFTDTDNGVFDGDLGLFESWDR